MAATLINVIDFLSGFRDDETQTGIPDLILAAEKAESLLIRNLTAWQDEEDTVQNEHRVLMQDTANFLEGATGPVTHSQLAEVISNIVKSSDANEPGSLANAIQDARKLVASMQDG